MRRLCLITTPDKQTWAKWDNLLFLGSWCIHGFDQHFLADSSNILVQNRWRDQVTLSHDYNYISELHDKLINSLALDLNKVHGVNNSVRYWRILIGPWLEMFITSLYHRWHTLERVCSDYELDTILLNYVDYERFIPNDMTQFSALILEDDWNHYVTKLCIEHSGFCINTRYKESCSLSHSGIDSRDVSGSSRSRRKTVYLIGIAKWLLSIASRPFLLFNRVFIFGSYLSRINELRLNLFFLGIPRFNYSEPGAFSVNMTLRSTLSPQYFFPSNAYEDFLSRQIFRQIPRSFLEGYDELVVSSRNLGYPLRPRVLFTSASLFYDTVMMCYAAEHIDRGAKLLCGQHGGYGLPKFMRLEDHEKAISDRFLTWGWSDDPGKTYPVGYIKKGSFERSTSEQATKILLVRGLWSPSPYRIDSGMGLDLNCAIQDSIQFASLLPSEIRCSDLLVRLYREDYGYSEAEKWYRSCPDVEIAPSNISIHKLIKKTRLAVYTYNVGTGWLEFMAAGIPTIAFWDMDASPVRDSCIPFFNELRNAGIFHDTPQSAAHHVERIWADVDGWWNSALVAAVRIRFCREYVNTESNLLSNIISNINDCIYASNE